MKTTELITKLQSLVKKHGDKELRFTVSDHYSRHGNKMYTMLSCGENTGLPSDWQDVFTNDKITTISFHLEKDIDGKSPKVTFRK